MEILTPDGINLSELHTVLAVVWLLAGGPLMLAALPVPALGPLRQLFWPIVRRGKLLRKGESTGKGLQRLTVPQSFFTHLYVVGLIWNTALFFTSLAFAVTCSRPAPEEHNLSSFTSQLIDGLRTDILGKSAILDIGVYSQEAWRLVFVLLLFEIHLIRRLYECLFVCTFDPSARMNLLGYITAIGYYSAVPLTLFLQSFHDEGFAKAFKGFLRHTMLKQGLHVIDAPSTWDVVYFLGRFGWMQYVGGSICLYSSIHQHRCHEILAAIRDDDPPRRRPPGSYRYAIPRGDWFEYVSSPHYLAEIGFYVGILISGGANSFVLWILLLSVVANLYLVAEPTHEWYLSKFDDYPTTRHALFPSVRQILGKT